MAQLEIRIPQSLGLSKEQIAQLEEGFRSSIADMVTGPHAEATALARPQAVSKKEIIQAQATTVIDV